MLHTFEPPATPTGAGRRAGRSATGRRELALQVGLIAGAALAYFMVRGLTEGSVSTANDHGRDVLAVEAALGVDAEEGLQGLVLGSDALVMLFNWIYIWGHWPAIGATLIWLHRSHPTRFVQLRNALFVSGAIGITIFVLYPVTPPRLLDVGIVDTVTEHSNSYRVLQPPSLTNKYAALPSLHVGWNLLIGLAVYSSAANRFMRGLGVLSPFAMIAAVILTGNHFVLDAAGGLVVAAVGWLVATRTDRSRGASPPEQLTGAAVEDDQVEPLVGRGSEAGRGEHAAVRGTRHGVTVID